MDNQGIIMKRTRFSAITAAIIGMSLSIAATFNRNVTGPSITAGPVHVRPSQNRGRRAFTTGIKGMASSNNTRYGASLKNHFDSKRGVAA